ncbi:MAG: glycosyltransferase family 4 protein [Candidatus Omnitrophica bacterium]|nr:glycosyltransferase family 4 protein [Candidatus Omnitrophota bacterium]MDD5775322.1 glycosyltransferase family 4 protein [Candidatus Omnitrophota bacterium]
MRILLIVHGLPPEHSAGVEVYTRSLCDELAKRHDVFLFTRCNDPFRLEYEEREERRGRLLIHSVNNTFRECSSFESTYLNPEIDARFRVFLDRVSPDVVHIQHMMFLSAGIIEQIKKKGVQIFLTLHDYWLLCPQGQFFFKDAVCDGSQPAQCATCVMYQLSIKKNIAAWITCVRRTLPEPALVFLKNVYCALARVSFLRGTAAGGMISRREAYLKECMFAIDHFTAPSRYVLKKFIVAGVPASKTAYMQYGFKQDMFPDTRKERMRSLRVGVIGNLMPAKGGHVAIRAFRGIPGDKAVLDIYGPAYSYKSLLSGYRSGIRAMIRQDNIRLKGSFDHDRIADVFREIDVLVVPSLWEENSPLVIQEAFLAKTPVIASRIGGIPELVTDGVNGLLFEPGNVEELRAAIERVIEDPSILDAWRANIPAVKSIEENAKELETIYAQLVSKP